MPAEQLGTQKSYCRYPTWLQRFKCAPCLLTLAAVAREGEEILLVAALCHTVHAKFRKIGHRFCYRSGGS